MKISSPSTNRVLALVLLAASSALSTNVLAMPGAGKADCTGMQGKHGQKTQAERMEQRAKHLAALKEKLNLTAQQAAAWDAFTSARQGQMPSTADRQAMRAEMASMTTPQRIDTMLARADSRRAKMVARAEATKAFYAQLTPAQQAVFDAEARLRGHGRTGHSKS